MVLSDLLGAIRRRWYLVVVGLLATIALTLAAASAAPPTYTARGLVLLVPSKAVVGEGGNPLLVMDGLTLPAEVLVAYYQGASAQEEAEKAVPDATYQVALDASTRGPVISVDVTGSTPEDAIKALNHISDSIPKNLARLQREVDAPPESEVSAMPLTMDSKATADTSAATRLRIGALGIGLAATLLLTSAIDGLLLRRQRRRAEHAAVPGLRLRAADDLGDKDRRGDERAGGRADGRTDGRRSGRPRGRTDGHKGGRADRGKQARPDGRRDAPTDGESDDDDDGRESRRKAR